MSDPHVIGEGLLPTPFSADEIRRGCPAGRTIRLRVVPASGPSYERMNRFADCDDEGATIESWTIGADGSQVDPAESRSTWLELQHHAAFPIEGTTVGHESLDLAFGRFECTVYTLGSGARFLFATELAGMPARYEIPDDEGLHVTEMVADQRP